VKQPPCCLQARLDTAACEPETLAQPLMVSHWILLLHGIVAAHLATLALCTQHAVLSAAATRALQTLLHAHDGLYTTAARIMLSAAKRNFASQLQPALSLLNDLQGVLKLPTASRAGLHCRRVSGARRTISESNGPVASARVSCFRMQHDG
jgi:hypothetical protein